MAKITVITALTDYTSKKLSELSIAEIADIIRKDWRKTKGKVHEFAVPYVDAMSCMEKITDTYIAESGKTIVAYFLSNASTWQGATAKEIKTYLNKISK